MMNLKASFGPRNIVYFYRTRTIIFRENSLSFFEVISLKNEPKKKREQKLLSNWGRPRKLLEGESFSL